MTRMGILGVVVCFLGCASEQTNSPSSKSPADAERVIAETDDAAAGGGKADSSRRPTQLGNIEVPGEGNGEVNRDHRYLAWTFSAEANSTVRLRASGGIDTVLAIYAATSSGNPRGRRIVWNDDESDTSVASVVEFTPSESGNYVALVRAFFPSERGAVVLKTNLLENSNEDPVKRCGGLLGRRCEDTEFCDFEDSAHCGAGDQTGICKPRPEACVAVLAPVCGCDGETYSNSCVAHTAGVDVAASGACGDDSSDAGPGVPDRCNDNSDCSAGEHCVACWGIMTCIAEGIQC